jgi:hypothetical protein
MVHVCLDSTSMQSKQAYVVALALVVLSDHNMYCICCVLLCNECVMHLSYCNILLHGL